jgi:uncharacterized membrane protein YbhN (UPF0104 family)
MNLSHNQDFWRAAAIAALPGFVSHAPGRLGFRGGKLVMLSQYQKEELAWLLILHILYDVLPLAVALVMLGVRETCTTSSQRSAFR